MSATSAETRIHISDEAWKALQGAYDLHVHVAPDVVPRRIDDIDLAKEFLAHGLRGFALKSHYVPTQERAAVVAKVVPGIDVLGTITLNHSVGGLKSGSAGDCGARRLQAGVDAHGGRGKRNGGAYTGRNKAALLGEYSARSGGHGNCAAADFSSWR